MNNRWLLLGYGLLFTGVTIGAIYQGEALIAAIAVTQAVFGFGGFWWNTTHERSVRWRHPREGALIMAKIVLALVGAIVITALAMIILPFSNFSPQTPGRVVRVGVFYTAWALLMFKLLFGEYVPRKIFKASEL
ncbi:hypothetical protein [Halostagnicola bangensis]